MAIAKELIGEAYIHLKGMAYDPSHIQDSLEYTLGQGDKYGQPKAEPMNPDEPKGNSIRLGLKALRSLFVTLHKI